MWEDLSLKRVSKKVNCCVLGCGRLENFQEKKKDLKLSAGT